MLHIWTGIENRLQSHHDTNINQAQFWCSKNYGQKRTQRTNERTTQILFDRKFILNKKLTCMSCCRVGLCMPVICLHGFFFAVVVAGVIWCWFFPRYECFLHVNPAISKQTFNTDDVYKRPKHTENGKRNINKVWTSEHTTDNRAQREKRA